MKRSELKNIVKECLLEILLEGVAGNQTQQVVRESSRGQIAPKQVVSGKKTHLDHIIPNPQKIQQVENKITQTVKNIVPNDPVMASIFTDTATTTLREQNSAEAGRGMPVKDTGIDPMSLFENAENWAALAFADSPAKRRAD